MKERPAVRLATSNRNNESQNIYCYEKVIRKQYLIEVYECYARNEVTLFQQVNNDKGCAGVNVYRKECVVSEEDDDDGLLLATRDKSICEKRSMCEQSCIIC